MLQKIIYIITHVVSLLFQVLFPFINYFRSIWIFFSLISIWPVKSRKVKKKCNSIQHLLLRKTPLLIYRTNLLNLEFIWQLWNSFGNKVAPSPKVRNMLANVTWLCITWFISFLELFDSISCCRTITLKSAGSCKKLFNWIIKAGWACKGLLTPLHWLLFLHLCLRQVLHPPWGLCVRPYKENTKIRVKVVVLYIYFLSTSSSEICILRDRFFVFVLSPNFHELWHSVMSVYSLKLRGHGVTASVHYLCLWWLCSSP